MTVIANKKIKPKLSRSFLLLFLFSYLNLSSYPCFAFPPSFDEEIEQHSYYSDAQELARGFCGDVCRFCLFRNFSCALNFFLPVLSALWLCISIVTISPLKTFQLRCPAALCLSKIVIILRPSISSLSMLTLRCCYFKCLLSDLWKTYKE